MRYPAFLAIRVASALVLAGCAATAVSNDADSKSDVLVTPADDTGIAADDTAAAAVDTGSAGEDTGLAADAPGTDAGPGPEDAADAAWPDVAEVPDSAAIDVPDVVALPVPPVLALDMGGWILQPKQEATRCVVKRLDFADPSWIHAIHTKLGKGSHHLIVYRSDETVEQITPFPCAPFTETLSGGNVPLMISQVAEETLTLPPGVAFQFKAHQMIRVEAHFLDYYATPITATASIEFLTLPKAEVNDEADLLFYGTPDFYLPAGKQTQTPWHYLPVLPGSHVFALTGHTHALGTNVEIALANGATATDPVLLYPPAGKSFSWSEAPMAYLTPEVVAAKDQGFQYRCSWDNTTSKNVNFGESATSEMCFFWGYYYPSKGYRTCISTGKYKKQAASYGIELGDSVCCPGDDACDLVKLFLKNAAQ